MDFRRISPGGVVVHHGAKAPRAPRAVQAAGLHADRLAAAGVVGEAAAVGVPQNRRFAIGIP